MNIVIVDTGVANISSVKFAFERLSITPLVSSKPEVIKQADRVVIPGVGSAPYAMKLLKQKRLISVLKVLKQPVLGICLGMQLLYETLDEGGLHVEGLGLLKGKVTLLNTKKNPSPHMGWNKLSFTKGDDFLNGIKEGSYVYFVHSYAAAITNNTLAKTSYGTDFSSIVKKNNIYGCQFHPERSSKVGANILENFMKIKE
jgi:imidazole glycerol-phosphate synthase subunit HisH